MMTTLKWASPLLALLVAGCGRQVLIPPSPTPPVTPAVESAEYGTLPPAGTEILAEGVAAVQGTVDIARDHAIDDALRNAVEQGVGVYIDSETEVSNYQLISDEIYSRACGYVSGYRIIHEERDGDLYRVVVRADVDTRGIEDDLAAIGILLAEQGRPRIMVVVRELTSLSEIAGDAAEIGGVMFETMLLDHFRRLGFPVVDAETVSGIMEREQLRLILEGDDHTAALVGLDAGAEIVIAGTVLHSEDYRTIAGSAREIHEFTVSSRAVNTRTGSLLAGSALTVELPFSESQARTRAADSTGSYLSGAILDGWMRGENTTIIVATNVDYSDVRTLASELRSGLRGVLDVITRDFIGSRATLEVASETSSQEVIDWLTDGDLTSEFEVTGMAGNRVEIRFID